MKAEDIEIHQASAGEALSVIEMVSQLLVELGGFATFDSASATELCRRLLVTESYTAFLAVDAQGAPLGVITLAEISALYVAGRLGWIQELFVAPEARSVGVGQRLIEAPEN